MVALLTMLLDPLALVAAVFFPPLAPALLSLALLTVVLALAIEVLDHLAWKIGEHVVPVAPSTSDLLPLSPRTRFFKDRPTEAHAQECRGRLGGGSHDIIFIILTT